MCLFLCGEEVFTVATSWLCGDARSVARVWLQFFCLSDLLAPSLPLHARWKKKNTRLLFGKAAEIGPECVNGLWINEPLAQSGDIVLKEGHQCRTCCRQHRQVWRLVDFGRKVSQHRVSVCVCCHVSSEIHARDAQKGLDPEQATTHTHTHTHTLKCQS